MHQIEVAQKDTEKCHKTFVTDKDKTWHGKAKDEFNNIINPFHVSQRALRDISWWSVCVCVCVSVIYKHSCCEFKEQFSLKTM